MNHSLQKQFLWALGFWLSKRARCRQKTYAAYFRRYWNANIHKVYSFYFSWRHIFQVVSFTMQMYHRKVLCSEVTRRYLTLKGPKQAKFSSSVVLKVGRLAIMPCSTSFSASARDPLKVQKDVAFGFPLFPLGDEFYYVRTFLRDL